MNDTHKTICNYAFQLISEIIPECDDDGNVKELYPQERYKKKDEYGLHKYGNGPFCKFKIAKSSDTGVYAFFQDNKIVYFGECENLGSRLSTGYGNISPKNCYEGGQQTNCRINNLIFLSARQKKKVTLYFYGTNRRKLIEKELIELFRPIWNK